ncbi:cation:dicarboxylase symporter family transporter [Streptobacillus felis]|uniref:Cation:dicarboxylase symporter family transporter n=1 Tax=Streptobacillus felis TaxID=1384509 RepID=A0A7Z0TC96_9FUSO|nr:cation:dicarboxylase symporter family transporter [Streptobacillus felis]NYV28178.1 cation:dicarboxylase symporter family transporter [Streptobacillus felis]
MVNVILNVIIFLVILFVLNRMASKRISFSIRVFVALGLGLLFGIVLHYVQDADTIIKSKEFFEVVSKSYVALLKMITMPLILVSIISAIINLNNTQDASKMGSLVIGILLTTAAISSFVAEVVTLGFRLDASGILSTGAGEKEIKAIERVNERAGAVVQTLADKVLSFIPSNPFADLTGARPTSTIAVVVFSIFIGVAILGMKKKKPETANILIDFINASYEVVIRMVKMILRLTPYGVFALMTIFASTSNFAEILVLLKFVIVSYVALISMFIIHLIMVSLFGFSPVIFVKKVITVLIFAFTSRTSAGAIPLTTKAQEDMGVDRGIANMAATFGTSIGQNGCAAIYPTMLAIMLAPTLGINPLDPLFLIRVIIIVTISSLGVVGVGGGATFAAIIVLSTLGFPIEIVGLLITVEPIIDMGRTALNVNGSVVAGLLTGKILNKVDKEKYNKLDVE